MVTFRPPMMNLLDLALVLLALSAVIFLAIGYRKRTKLAERNLTDLQAEEDRVFDFLHGIGAAFSEGVRSSELHRLLVESAARILEGSGGALYLANKEESVLTPTHISKDCVPFVDVPAHVKAQAEDDSNALWSYLQLQSITRDSAGIIADCWRSGEIQFLTAGEHGLAPDVTVIAGPLIYRHKVMGVLAILTSGDNPHCDSKGLKVFRTIAEQSAFALYNEAIYLEAGEKQLIDRDLEIARDIQRILLPDADPVFPGYKVSALSLAARQVSGDYFDYIPLSDGRLGVAIADASGKGVPASLIMAMCRGVLRREAVVESTPSKVLQRVNHHLYPDIKEDMFISMAYMILNPDSGEICMTRAGHDAPLLFRAATQTVEQLRPKGMALGIDSGEVFNRVCGDFRFEMHAGDCLLLYTDGATEALDPGGMEYGLDRLTEALKTSAPHGSAGIIQHIAQEVKQFTGNNLRQDDFTLIAILKQ
jgi:phosphoserine phosphatase RsbU/P